MDCQMIYLRYLATLLTNGALAVRMLPVMPRVSTINYVTPLPVTLITAQHIVIHFHPQLPHHLLKHSLSCFHPILLHQCMKHPLWLHTQPLLLVPGNCSLVSRIRQGILLVRVDVSQRQAGSRQSGAWSRPTNLTTMGGKVGMSGRTGRGAKVLSRCEVSARQDAMTYLVGWESCLMDGKSREQEVLDHIHTPNVVYIQT